MAGSSAQDGSDPSGGDETLAGTLAGSPARRADGPPVGRGHQIGRYVVIDRIGAGGMGVVFAAYDPELDRKVALKLLHAELADHGESSQGQRRLLREAQALARLQHPNVVAVHDVGEHDGRVFLAMEFVEGETLGGWLKTERSRGEVLAMFVAAGQGIVAAHAKGLVHRDFKPENVMVADGRPRVMDFGLVRASEDAEPRRELSPTTSALDSRETRDDAIAGTPAYMAPEQHLGLEVGPLADQFAFCVALYEALYGERPFRGKTLAALALNVTRGRLADPPRNRSVPAHLRRALLRGLDNKATRRWPDMQTLLAELQRDTRGRTGVLVVGAMVVTGVIGGVSWQEWRRGEALATCHADAESIREEWDASTVDRIATAFGSTGLSYAGEAFAQLEPWMDRFVDGWIRNRETVCRAEIEGGHLEGEQLVRAGDCLELQRAQFGAFVERISNPDAFMVQNAVASGAGLPLPDVCIDPISLARQPTMQAEQRDELMAIRSGLGRAKVQHATRDLEGAQETLTEARARAEALGHAGVLASVVLEEGRVATTNAEYDRGHDLLVAAHVDAGAIGEDELAAEAAIALARLAVTRSRTDEVRQWSEVAGMWLDRMRTPKDDVRRTTVLEAMAAAEGIAGNYDQAVQMQEEVVEQRRRVLGEDHPQVGNAMRRLAVTYTKMGRYGEALEGHRQALASLAGALGENHPDVAYAHHSLGLAYQDHGQDEEALAEYRTAVRLATAGLGEDHPAVSASLENAGLIHRKRKEFDLALENLERALEINRRALGEEDPVVAGTLSNLGIVERNLGNLDRALELYEESLRLRRAALGVDHPEVGISLANIAGIHARKGDARRALEVFEQALEIWRTKLPADHPMIATALRSTCEMHRELREWDQAIADCEGSMRILMAPDRDPHSRAASQLELAKTLHAAGRDRPRALELGKQARAGFLEHGVDVEVEAVDEWLESLD